MKLKTSFWESNTNTEWRNKTTKIIEFTNLVALANMCIGLMNSMWIMTGINGLIIIIGILMLKSKKKWEKENDRIQD